MYDSLCELLQPPGRTGKQTEPDTKPSAESPTESGRGESLFHIAQTFPTIGNIEMTDVNFRRFDRRKDRAPASPLLQPVSQTWEQLNVSVRTGERLIRNGDFRRLSRSAVSVSTVPMRTSSLSSTLRQTTPPRNTTRVEPEPDPLSPRHLRTAGKISTMSNGVAQHHHVVNTAEDEVFTSAAEAMAAAGLAVLPLRRDRTPLVTRFNTWQHAPCQSTVKGWVADYPDANVGILPGLSGVTVVDGDDLAQDDDVEELRGATPLTVRTNRGRHRYYQRADAPLPRNLRAFGLDADILQGNAIVIAPPSIHRSGTRYTLEGADWSALRDLPPLNTERLRQLIGKHVKLLRRGNAQWLNLIACAPRLAVRRLRRAAAPSDHSQRCRRARSRRGRSHRQGRVAGLRGGQDQTLGQGDQRPRRLRRALPDQQEPDQQARR